MERKWHVTHVSEIPDAAAPEPGFYAWKPVRRHFDVRSFGINAFVAARAGDWAVEEHDELGETAGRHEELYFVASGRATFRLDDEQLEAAAGTFVFVPTRPSSAPPGRSSRGPPCWRWAASPERRSPCPAGRSASSRAPERQLTVSSGVSSRPSSSTRRTRS